MAWLIFGLVLLAAGAPVLAGIVAYLVASRVCRRAEPYDFDTHADTAMAILTPDDPQLARLNRWAELDRADVLWPVPDGSHDAVHLTPTERADIEAIEDLARRTP